VKRRQLLVPLIAMLVVSFGGLALAKATSTSPVLGLDLQGGFSVVLQAKEVNGRLPSEESVDKAMEIIRQRVDGLGVAEPDISRQGRTVVIQLPGVKNRAQAESLVGCTARLEFRPVLSRAINPNSPGLSPATSGSTAPADPTTTTSTGAGTTAVPGESTTTAVGASTTATTAAETSEPETEGGSSETGMAEFEGGAVGLAPGEGALPVQFAPTTTTPPTTTEIPTTTAPTTTAPSTTVPATTGSTATTVVDGSSTTTTTAAGAGSSGSGSSAACGSSGVTVDPPIDSTGLPEGAVNLLSEDGSIIYTLGPVAMEGDSLSKADAVLTNGEWQVVTAVKRSQVKKANEAFNACYEGAETCPAAGGTNGSIAIVLDGVVLSAPAVQGPDLASGDSFQISGDFTEGEAKDLALVLRYGSLPVEFEQAALRQVSATLGSDSLRAGLLAGAIGIAALCLYMILYYRGFGLVVVVSLLVWMALMYGVVCLLSESQGLALSLAGITGIIVSVGTTVDTYVVVFERVKDEVRKGRSIRRATEVGYHHGIRTVLTANGAAFIGAFLLWYLTVGPVRGFAYFLGISVIVDLTVAIFFTRPLILLMSRSPRFANSRLFGLGAATDRATSSPKAVTA